jgi:hypothetical protein
MKAAHHQRRSGFLPSLDKEGWREAPGWFDAAVPPLRPEIDSQNRLFHGTTERKLSHEATIIIKIITSGKFSKVNTVNSLLASLGENAKGFIHPSRD